MACGTLLQVDQAEPQDQSVLRDLDQRGQDSGLDRPVRLRPGGHHQEGAQERATHERNPANSEHLSFREYARFAGFFADIRERQYVQ